MRELSVAQLPEHDALKKYQEKAPVELTRFVSDALTEGRNFIKDYFPTASKVVDGSKASPPATATVEVRYHKVHKGLPEAKPVYGSGRESHSEENWFGRSSIHENAAKEGTASWQECYDGLKSDHSAHEVDYTPDCINAHRVLDWKTQLSGFQDKIAEWQDVTMDLVQMTHKLPFPLNKRVFTVLVISARKDKEFLTLQIPAESKLYEKVSNAEDPNKVGTPGIYCSVEWCQLLEEDKKIKWDMATASDAKGVLPMIAQKPAMPQAVAQDVGLFMDWCEKKRKGTAQVTTL
jgi:hypothetical protein